MKKIINGKLYDTDTARKVGECSHGGGRRDFHYFEETLYCKRTGEYYLYGWGGPASRYARQIEQNSWSSGEQIIPLTYVKAKEWAERELTVDEYQAEFGEVAEDDSRETLNLSLDAGTANRIRRAAAEAGVSISEIVARQFREC